MHPTHAMRQHNYPSLGLCIYCLRSEELLDPLSKLTEEHIVPRGLNGTLIFKGAACERCARDGNQRFEQPAMNADFLVPRLLLELRRRKKKETKALPMAAQGDRHMDVGQDGFDLELDVYSHPKILTFIHSPPAGIYTGEMENSALANPQVSYINISTSNDNATYGVTLQSKHESTAFPLSVIKMAYAFAVAEKGFDYFDGSDIRDVLSGKNPNTYTYFGASTGTFPPALDQLHHLSLSTNDGYLVVKVHLFASYGVPPYEVVVGKILVDASVAGVKTHAEPEG